jgi:putative peptidoglycan lipid II flippase
LLFAIIAGGALAIALIPVLSEYLERGGRSRMWDLFSRVANLVFIITAALSIIVALFTNLFVDWLAPGFSADQQALVVELMRLNLISTLLFSLSGLVMAGLQTNQHFLLPAIAPSMYDIGGLFGLIILAPESGYHIGPVTLPAFGMGIYGVLYGTVIGSALFLLVQLPGLIIYQFHWRPWIDLRNPGVLQVLHVLLPRALNVLFFNLIFIFQERFASYLVTGSVNALSLGWLFMQVPETLIGTAIGTALLPTLSEQVARGEREQFQNSLNHSFRTILALTIPVTILLVVVIPSIVSILGLEPAIADLVVWTSRGFLLGLVGHSLLEISVRAFYAQQNARVPVIAAGATLVMFILIGAVLSSTLGAPGIGIASSIVFTGESLVLWFLLSRRYTGLLTTGRMLYRVALGTAISSLVASILISQSSSFLVGAGTLIVGGILVIPFILPEIRLLLKL